MLVRSRTGSGEVVEGAAVVMGFRDSLFRITSGLTPTRPELLVAAAQSSLTCLGLTLYPLPREVL